MQNKIMAEGGSKTVEETTDNNSSNLNLECAVCLQTCVHPSELPCGHIFCFLCIKGIAFQSGRCAMCREIIPHDYLLKPKLVTPLDMENSKDTYHWYYEGYSGWWQYDQRASTEIEDAYQKGEKSCQLLLAGFLYVIDFNSMVQYRQTHPVRRRRIKRDRATTDKLGVAGLRSDTEGTNFINETLVQNIEDVEMGLQNLWYPTGSNGIANTNSADRAQSLPPTDDRFQNFGVESIGPEDCPGGLAFLAVSPTPRDGRTFNPRLELGDGGDEDSDELEEIDEEPLRIFSGANAASPAAFRPLPLRLRGRNPPDLDTSNRN